MQLPLTDPETLFEELLQDLPPETMQMAREFRGYPETWVGKRVDLLNS